MKLSQYKRIFRLSLLMLCLPITMQVAIGQRITTLEILNSYHTS